MQLRGYQIHHNKKWKNAAKALYLSAFPKEERLPWWILWCNSLRPGIDLTAWTDDGEFCGFTYSVTVDGLHFLLFFAVAEDRRGMGYGSAILSQLKETYGTVVLNVEPLIPDAPNYIQRQSRFAFYGKNGFFDTGYDVWEVGGKFRVLCTDPVLNMALYKQLFKKLTFGVWNVKVRKDNGFHREK